MASEELNQFHQSLRSAFYQQHDQELMAYLDELQGTKLQPSDNPLESLGGIRDPEVLQSLAQLDITTENILAFTLLPLVRMAWADRQVQDAEFDVILKAAEADGLREGSIGYRLLSRWLEQPPSESMLDAWRLYARALAQELDDATLEAVRHEVLGRAYRIAEISGGFLGINKISDNERLVLEDLGRALSR